jgi:hypothetical protein
MSENVLIAIVAGIVVVVVFALWILKDRVDIFSFAASKKSVIAKMEQRQNTGITVSGNTQDGNNNEIAAETANSTIENNLQKGNNNLIRAAASKK